MDLHHAAPICQGIQLVPVATLPDRLRTVFPYPTFNAVQSKCFDTVFGSNDNFVLASPTGSGKTVILELAICRAVATNATGQYKVVYQAPTKALCSERQRDWAAKFTPIGLKCAELTGDSDASDVRNVQSANIIITTPEKWDSITRKWKDHEKLMRLIKVFLIDEVHILKEDRGAVLEAVVSRMKSIGTDVRFVALSATVPNFGDVATWLGKSSSQPYIQAPNEKFGEEFRPVKLRKHVCGYASNTSNEFGFEKTLDGKLPEVIAKFSEGKPIMIFCATRASCLNTAKLIARWWISRPGNDRKWTPPSKQVTVLNKDLRETVASGVAFHHAGLDSDDRMQVEREFLGHNISVICCTSTLAVGVNLPCHLVIIKNTVTYTDEGLQEYSDLEIMQMLGRAGRPQFDNTAVAVIMTRQTKARRYEMMVTGLDLLESKLHFNLVDHMNAEIGLGTIRDLASARKWLKGTFLYIRLQQNPNHYKLEGAKSGQEIEEQVDDICSRNIALLREHTLVSDDEYFRCTEFGHAMARYYVHFETMRVFMGIQSKATPSEIVSGHHCVAFVMRLTRFSIFQLSAIAQASEFSRLRFRAGEKPMYKLLNKSPSIRFSIPVNLDLPAHKVSLIIQSVLGSADLTWDGELAKHKSQYIMETQIVFKHISSLIRCVIDCQICLGDSVSIHSALMLERSLGSRVWDDSPLQMKQIESIGVVGVRKFVNAGIRTLEDLETCEPHRIEALIGRNPPYGMKVLETVRTFPKLRVSLHVQPSSIIKCADRVKIQVKADIGFINETLPQRFAGKLVYVCLLAETSDGRKIHFARISGQRLGHGQSLVFPAILTGAEQSINCYVMCDSIAGSLRGATVRPQIAPSMFPVPKPPASDDTPQRSNTSKRRAEPTKPARQRSNSSDDFGDDGIDDEELVKATCGDLEFEHIDNFANPTDAITRKTTAKNKTATKAKNHTRTVNTSAEDEEQEPIQLNNGKWACKHPCKDKNACRHLCCKEGMDKPPKRPAATKRTVVEEEDNSRPGQGVSSQTPKVIQSKFQLAASKRKPSITIEELDLTQEEKKKKVNYAVNEPKDYCELHLLHKTIQKKDLPSTLHSVMHTKPAYCYSQGGDHSLSFLRPSGTQHAEDTSDYGDAQFDELSSYFDVDKSMPIEWDTNELGPDMDLMKFEDYTDTARVASLRSDTFGDNDSLLGDAMVGLADSQKLQETSNSNINTTRSFEDTQSMEFEARLQAKDFSMETGEAADDGHKWHAREVLTVVDSVIVRDVHRHVTRAPFPYSASSPHTPLGGLISKNVISKNLNLGEHEESQVGKSSFADATCGKTVADDVQLLDLRDMFDDEPVKAENPVPDGFIDLEPWLFQEFGDIVELVDA
jgi:ATP-dependent DNA helicase HFM1/MER3